MIIHKRQKKGSRAVSMLGFPASSQNLLPIELLSPTFVGGKSVSKALKQRKTVREISDKKLSLQVLSNLLWAACGVNRNKGPFGIPGRTAASASNSQEIDLYVAIQQGIYLYDPFHLIYIVDVNKLSNTSGYQEPGLQDPEIQKGYYHVDTGLIAGNVYLFAASQGLASWFHNCNRSGLTAKLKLCADQRVLFGQTVGYPVKE